MSRSEAIRLYLSGLSLSQVGARAGVKLQTVWKWLKEAGVPRRPQVRPDALSAEERTEIVRLYQSGFSSVKVAEKVGRSLYTCLAVLRKAAVPLRGMAAIRKSGVRTDFFAAIDTDEKAYWLGFLAADGCVVGRYIVVNLHMKDAAHLEKLRAAVAPTAKLYDVDVPPNGWRKKKTRQKRFSLWAPELVADLARHGISPRKSLTLKAWNGPPHLLAAYFRGLIDGDGCWFLKVGGRPRPIAHLANLIATKSVARSFLRFVHRASGVKCGSVSAIKCGLVVVQIHNRVVLQRLAAALYENATVFLERKKSIADRICELPTHHHHAYRDIV